MNKNETVRELVTLVPAANESIKQAILTVLENGNRKFKHFNSSCQALVHVKDWVLRDALQALEHEGKIVLQKGKYYLKGREPDLRGQKTNRSRSGVEGVSCSFLILDIQPREEYQLAGGFVDGKYSKILFFSEQMLCPGEVLTVRLEKRHSKWKGWIGNEPVEYETYACHIYRRDGRLYDRYMNGSIVKDHTQYQYKIGRDRYYSY